MSQYSSPPYPLHTFCRHIPLVSETSGPPIRRIGRSSIWRRVRSWDQLIGNAINGSTLSTTQSPRSYTRVYTAQPTQTPHRSSRSESVKISNRKHRKVFYSMWPRGGSRNTMITETIDGSTVFISPLPLPYH